MVSPPEQKSCGSTSPLEHGRNIYPRPVGTRPNGETDARKPHHHCRFPERSDVLPAAWRWEGVPRMCPRLRDVPGLSVHTQGDLSRWRMPDTPLLLRPCPPRGAHHLADTVHDVSRRVHGSAALRLALSFHACGPQ